MNVKFNMTSVTIPSELKAVKAKMLIIKIIKKVLASRGGGIHQARLQEGGMAL